MEPGVDPAKVQATFAEVGAEGGHLDLHQLCQWLHNMFHESTDTEFVEGMRILLGMDGAHTTLEIALRSPWDVGEEGKAAREELASNLSVTLVRLKEQEAEQRINEAHAQP